MLFSRIFEFLKNRNAPIENTAAGMEAEMVKPTLSPRNALAAVKMIVRKTAKIVPFNVISGRD